MANGYILHRPISLHPTLRLDLAQARRWLQGLVERSAPPPSCIARPLGLHLSERVWRRHGAWLTCLAERDSGKAYE